MENDYEEESILRAVDEILIPRTCLTINSCNLLVNLTFLVRTHLKVYPELQSMSFSIPSKATIVLVWEREAFSSVYNGHVGSETDH